MNATLKALKDIRQDACLTVILNTHRTHPDNAQDPILLKTLLREAEERVLANLDKAQASQILAQAEALANSIDHQQNLESLVLFVGLDFAKYVRLPISVENRVVLDKTFATRDLVRALHQEAEYYILVLSRHQARLLEAHNDRVVAEFDGEFPIKNETLYSTDKQELSSDKQDKLMLEFYNRVDKRVLALTKDNPLPIVLVAEKRNWEHYQSIADQKHRLLGFVNRNRDDEPGHALVKAAWEVVLPILQERHQARIAELKRGVAQNKFVSDYREIYRAIHEGRGQTLFVKKGYFQSGLMVDGELTFLPEGRDLSLQEGFVDDVIDELIEANLRFGGDTVFINGDELEAFEHLALLTRY